MFVFLFSCGFWQNILWYIPTTLICLEYTIKTMKSQINYWKEILQICYFRISIFRVAVKSLLLTYRNRHHLQPVHRDAGAGAHLQTTTDIETTKGRITTRTLTASTLLTEHADWPGLQQVYQYTTHQKSKKTGQVKCYTQYGITSLTPQRASAVDLLKRRREHWTKDQ